MKVNVVSAVMALLALVSCGSAYYSSNADNDEYVNVGYGKVRKSQNTMSVSRLDMKKDLKTTSYTNIYEYLQGRVAGVDVDGTTIRIRGERSLIASNEPLFIVDGMQVSDISDIDPNMVSSIEVLKDGASTSVYGSRGANGVILITLRSE